MKQALGHYVFFIDFEAHRLEPAAAEALAGVRARVHRLWLLGSYPRGGPALGYGDSRRAASAARERTEVLAGRAAAAARERGPGGERGRERRRERVRR